MIYLLSACVFTSVLVGLSWVLLIAEKLLVNYGVCNVSINADERAFEIDGGLTLLASLYENEIFIPSACGGKGSCGFCKVSVSRGGGPVLPTETPYLTRKEVRSGVRLACQVKVKEDLDMRIPEDFLNVKKFSAVVESTRTVTYDIKEIRFSLIEPDEISHRPGQYVQVEAPSSDGPVFRAYSISSPVQEPKIVQLVVRLMPGGIGSTYLHALTEGEQVSFTGPYGEFVLSDDPETEVVCVGGGCGMAPMRNIIYTLYDRWPDRTCWLFFGCRGTRDIFYLEDLQEFEKKHPNFRAIYALSDPLEPGGEWDGETGFIHLSADKYLKPDVKRQAFLCGPPPMIDAVTAVLKDKGLRDDDIFYDKF